MTFRCRETFKLYLNYIILDNAIPFALRNFGPFNTIKGVSVNRVLDPVTYDP